MITLTPPTLQNYAFLLLLGRERGIDDAVLERRLGVACDSLGRVIDQALRAGPCQVKTSAAIAVDAKAAEQQGSPGRRRRQIMALLVDEVSAGDIARLLGITVNTVSNHAIAAGIQFSKATPKQRSRLAAKWLREWSQ